MTSLVDENISGVHAEDGVQGFDAVLSTDEARELRDLKLSEDNLYYRGQVEKLSNRVGVHRTVVGTILKDYRNMLQYQVLRLKKPVTFLGLVSFRQAGTDFTWYETTGKQALNIATARGYSYPLVMGVLQAYRSMILEELSRGRKVVVTGLVGFNPGYERVYLGTSDSFKGEVRSFTLPVMKKDLKQISAGRLFKK